MFSNLRIAAKLSLLIGLLAAAMVLVGFSGIYALREAQAANAASFEVASNMVRAVDSARAAEVAFKVQLMEFKNLLLRGTDREEYAIHLAAFNKRGDAVGKELDRVGELMKRLGVPTGTVDEARRNHATIVAQFLEGLKMFDGAKVESALTVDGLVRGKDDPLEAKIQSIVATLEKFSEQEGTRLATAAAAESMRVTAFQVLLIAVALVAGIALGVMVTRGITGPIGTAVSASRRVADGDLSVELGATGRDETGQLLQAVAAMTHKLRALVGEVATGAHAVSGASSQIAQGNLDLSQRTEEQACMLEQTASSLVELTSTVSRNAQDAQQASQLAVDASDVARKGGQVVGQVVSTMTGIAAASRRIADIIGVIDGIAFQTNILALNAAVEAARAGEQGRGFAVVAAEVRNLAQRSAAASREIKALIGDSVGQVEAGTRLVDAAGRTMQEIVTSVGMVSDLIAGIATASRQQSAGIGQVNTAVSQMDRVVQQNASLVEEATAATESMKQQAGALLTLVSRFQVKAHA